MITTPAASNQPASDHHRPSLPITNRYRRKRERTAPDTGRELTHLLGQPPARTARRADQSLKPRPRAAHCTGVPPKNLCRGASPAQITAAKLIDAEYGRLDILINNTAITRDRRRQPGDLPVADLREIYETNVFGVVALTNALLPLLRRSPAGYIGNVSSGLGTFAFLSDIPAESGQYANLLGYNSSKAALNAITLIYANSLHAEGITVNALSPGFFATDLNNHSGHLSPEGYSFRTTVGRMGRQYLIPLSAENRQAAGVSAGDTISIEITLDAAGRTVPVPADLDTALDPEARAYFDSLSFSHRKEWVRWIEEAKKPETRTGRVAKTVDALRAGRPSRS